MMRMMTTGERIATRCTTRKHPDNRHLKSAKTSCSRKWILGKQWKSSGNGRVDHQAPAPRIELFRSGFVFMCKRIPARIEGEWEPVQNRGSDHRTVEPHARWFGLIGLSRDFLGAGYWKGIPPFLCVCCVLFYFLFRVKV